MDDEDLGKLRRDLRLTREKQARLRYQIRYMQRQIKVLRDANAGAILSLEEGDSDHALALLDQALNYSNKDPDPSRLPAGAKRSVLKRTMEEKRRQKEER